MNPFPATNPARLDRRLTLLYPTAARDAAGGVVTSWMNMGTVWADYAPQPGREIQQAAEKVALAVANFRIRFRSITETWRVLFGEVLYEIIAPPVEVGRRSYLDLVCRALNPGNAGAAIGFQAITVDLAQGDTSVDIEFPRAFQDVPNIYPIVVAPADGFSITATPVEASITTQEATINLGAEVPAAGYKLTVFGSLTAL